MYPSAIKNRLKTDKLIYTSTGCFYLSQLGILNVKLVKFFYVW